MKEIKISIIVPVYNAEKYLEECIESVLRQTHRPAELILVDDGSTDQSRVLLRKYEKAYPWISVLTQENRGAPAARNYGFSECGGDYVLFFDADDVLRPDALTQLIRGTESGTADIVFGVRKYDLEADDAEVHRQYGLHGGIRRYTKDIPQRLYDRDPLPGNKLYRRQFLTEHHLVFSDLQIGQDLNYYLKALFFARKVCFVDSLVMDYRLAEGGISRIYKLEKLLAIKDSLDNAEQFVLRESVCDTAVIRKVMNSSRVINYSVQAEKLKRVDGFLNRMKGYAFFGRNSRKFLWNRRKLCYTRTLEMRRRKLIKYLVFCLYLSARH